MNEKRIVEQFPAKATPGATDLLPFWDFGIKKMVRMTFSNLVQFLKGTFSETGHNHDSVYLKSTELRTTIRPVLQAENTKPASEKAVAEALSAIDGIKNYSVCFPSTNREYLDTLASASRITDVELKEGAATFSYSINGGSFVTPALPLAAPIAIPAGQVIRYRMTHTPGSVLGLIHFTYELD